MEQISFEEFINNSYDVLIKQGYNHENAVKEMKRVLNEIEIAKL